MAQKPKPKPASGWGELNVALNRLVKTGVIQSYSTGARGKEARVTVEVMIDTGADQAEVVQLVREALPEDYREAQVRTKLA